MFNSGPLGPIRGIQKTRIAGDLKTRQRYYGAWATKGTRVPDTCVLLLYLSSGLSNRIVSWPIVGRASLPMRCRPSPKPLAVNSDEG